MSLPRSYSFIKGKKVLVTGANGFIGSHAVKRLVSDGADVTIFVRESSDLWRLENERKEIQVQYADLRDGDKVANICKQVKPDYVFHMAAYGVDSRQKDTIIASETNIIGTINLLNAISETECEKFISTGTSMQYGNKEGIITEDMNLTPSNIYGSTKAGAMILSHQIAKERGLNIVTIIPFGVFGENEGSHKFFPHIILSLLNDKDVELSLCEQYRDYCYIDNIIDGFIMAAQRDDMKNEIFNIGSGVANPLRYYVDIIFKQMKTDKKPLYGAVEYRKNDLWDPKPDTSKIRRVLGWEPQITLEQGIGRTIDWYKENYEKYSKTLR